MGSRHFDDAVDAARHGDRERAFRLLRQVILENPNHAAAWVWMSRVIDDEARQKECLERALVIDPKNQEAHNGLESLRIQALLAPVHARIMSDQPSGPRMLGDFLLEEGLISSDQLSRALREQRANSLPGRRVPLGEILIRQGMLTIEQMTNALIKQQERRTQPEQVGDYLVSQQLITKDQLASVLAEQARLRLGGKSVKLGELMVRKGFVKNEQLNQALAQQQHDFHQQIR